MTNKKQDTIRNPLGRARGLGTAKDGVHHWWMQRVTSVAIIPLIMFFLFHLPGMTSVDYGAFIGWMKQPSVSVAALLFVISAFYHAALGIQVIVEDYFHYEFWKITILLVNKLVFFFLAFVAGFAILYINFGL